MEGISLLEIPSVVNSFFYKLLILYDFMKRVYFVFFFFLLISCKKTFVPMDSSSVSIEDFKIEEVDFKYLSAKSKFQYKNENQLINATLNMRIEKGKKIWFSIRVALGFEAARGLITENSLKIIDRVNKEVLLASPEAFEREFKIKLRYDQIESILIGNMIENYSDEDNIIREGDYIKIAQKKDSLQTQNVLNLRNSKIEKIIIFDELTNYLLTIVYEDFKPLGKSLFPTQHSFTSISYSEDNTLPLITNINFSYNKVEKTNKVLKFPFNVPSKYDVKEL